MGKKPNTTEGWKKKGGKLCQKIWTRKPFNILMHAMDKQDLRALVYGAHLRAWRFDAYRTAARPMPPILCTEMTFVTHETLDHRPDAAIIESVHWARQLVNEPANHLTPPVFVQRLEELSALGITVEVLSTKELEKEGHGALLGVGQGSLHPPYLVALKWLGDAASKEAPLALVGKGVTFDSGGYSIKPASGMEDMKMDMTGAAVVGAVVKAMATRKEKVNVIGVVALVENMVSDRAQRPGDIVTSASGQTIEVLNTDAEGRLILADALHYAKTRFKPRMMVDIATLTGAIRVALGPVYAAVFSNQPEITEELIKAGKDVSELLWPMPLHPRYDESMNSDHADLKNIASPGFGGGSCTAAAFLHRFVGDTPWAHLDIANVDHLDRDTECCPKGGSAFGVQLLCRWILESLA
jgi:leucyl aminopeptidase